MSKDIIMMLSMAYLVGSTLEEHIGSAGGSSQDRGRNDAHKNVAVVFRLPSFKSTFVLSGAPPSHFHKTPIMMSSSNHRMSCVFWPKHSLIWSSIYITGTSGQLRRRGSFLLKWRRIDVFLSSSVTLDLVWTAPSWNFYWCYFSFNFTFWKPDGWRCRYQSFSPSAGPIASCAA